MVRERSADRSWMAICCVRVRARLSGGGRRGASVVVGAVALSTCAAAIAACGEDPQAPEPPAPLERKTADGAPGDRAAPDESPTTNAGADEGATDGEAGGAPSVAGEADEGAPTECAFEAPPGRLAQDRILLELAGVDCDQGRSLARAAALGQPAGANLALTVDGFDCEPSTRTKGANVTYICTAGTGEVSFAVVWSDAGN